ncbi:MAG: small multi-drug export protein [Candidatus Aenigmatarchaeota archaeon]
MLEYLSMLITLIPWVELRGSIPIGVALGLNPWMVLASAIVLNILIFFPVYFGLKYLYKYVQNWRIIKRVVSSAQKRSEKFLGKKGILALAVFIGVPLPFTGVYSGTIIAWLIGMDWKRTLAAVVLGVLITATIIFAIVMGAVGLFGFLLPG